MKPTLAALQIMSIVAANPQRMIWHYAVVRKTGWDKKQAHIVLTRLVQSGWLTEEHEDRDVRARKLYRATQTGLSEARKALELLRI